MKHNTSTWYGRPMRVLVAVCAAVAVIFSSFVATQSAGATPSDKPSGISSIIPRASEWSYYRGNSAPAAGWRTTTSGWKTGEAPLGAGTRTGKLNTTLPTVEGKQPLSAYFRKSFTLTPDLPEWAWLNTWADDGIVVWVNGVEIGRANAPDGTVTANSYAVAAPSSAAARSTPVSFPVPATALKTGENVIAVQVLSNWRRTPNISFDAHLVREDHAVSDKPSRPGEPRPVPPTVPGAPPLPAPPTAEPGSGEVAGWGAPTWRDEFTYVDRAGRPAVDPTKWNVRDQDDLGLLFDAAVVDRGQVSVDKSGILHLRADWMEEPTTRPKWQRGPSELWHRTGYLDQRHLESGDVSLKQRYGRWEIRAKTPTGPDTLGALAAFWLRNDQSGEIDIMEAWGRSGDMGATYRNYAQDTAATTIHTETDGTGRKRIWRHAEHGATAVPWDGFHVYAFELTPTYAATFVDGVEVMRVTPETYPDLWNETYFGSPLHVRLNLHVGPSETHWGLPDPNNKSRTQRLDYQVDYVRMWEYPGS